MNFSGCDTDGFYSKTNTTNRNEMHALLQRMHRKVVPYTSNNQDDCWDALIDLDSNQDKTQIHLLYRNTYMDIFPYGTTTTWNREHIWPKSHGVGDTGPDFSDLHHLRPADWNVNSARSNKHFSSCGVVNNANECMSPAHSEAADDTERDSSVFLPPGSKRGDVARAVFYMDVRYDGDENGVVDLELSDCPDSDPSRKLGYLSQLLQWHVDDPVDDGERRRNDGVCRKWQGNRNPFVDFPDLVMEYFGNARGVVNSGGLGYECPTSSPVQCSATDASCEEMPVTPTGECAGLSAGDVMITGFRSDNPDVVVLVALNDISAGIEIYMTDNAWTGSKFKSNEGVKKLFIPTNITAGSIFGFGTDNSIQLSTSWKTISGSFALSAQGDNIFLYCATSNNNTPLFLSGLIYTNGGWSPESTLDSSFSSSQSALPKSLCSNCVVSLPHSDNYIYVGNRNGKKENLLKDLSSPGNWLGSDDGSFDVISNQSPFVVNYEVPSSSPPSTGLVGYDMFLVGIVTCYFSLFYVLF